MPGEVVRPNVRVVLVGAQGPVKIRSQLPDRITVRWIHRRCESTRTDCQARPSYLAMFFDSRGRLHKAMLCQHHRDALSERRSDG